MRETASKSALMLSGCTRWMHPQAKWYQDRAEDSSAREDGKAIHEAIHLHANGLPYQVSGEIAKKVAAAVKYYDEELVPRCKWIKTEVAMGVNIHTGKSFIVEITDREYPKDDDVFYGTSDVVAMLNSGKLLIADWKSRGGDGAEEQLKSLCWMAGGIWPNEGYRISTLYIGYDSDTHEDKVIPVERDVYTGEYIQHISNLNDVWKSVSESPKPSLPVVGPYCTTLYCPHAAKCPATLYAMDGIDDHIDMGAGTRDFGHDMFYETPLDKEHAGWMAARLKAVARAQKYYEGHLKDWIRAGNKAKWNGYEYKETGRGFMLVKSE